MPDSAVIHAGTSAVASGAGALPRALPIRFRGVSFAAGPTRILSDVDLTIAEGGVTVLIGPNGSGKTTLIKLAMGLIVPVAGSVTFCGAAEPPRGSRALVFQKPVMLRRTVADNVRFALSAAGHQSTDADVASLLELTHTTALAQRPARRLSGGEQSRVALARALARDPQVLLLDEPTASLDPASTKLVEEIIRAVVARGVTVVMSTHDLGQARRLGSHVVFLANGRVAEVAAAERFFADPRSGEARRFLAGDLVL